MQKTQQQHYQPTPDAAFAASITPRDDDTTSSTSTDNIENELPIPEYSSTRGQSRLRVALMVGILLQVVAVVLLVIRTHVIGPQTVSVSAVVELMIGLTSIYLHFSFAGGYRAG
jgi:hypothetical protein